jgi:hypothetical protein
LQNSRVGASNTVMFAGGIVTAFAYNAADPAAFIASLEVL